MEKSLKGKKRILITSALPYANGPIHIGHLVEYIQTDIYSRFLKLQSFNAIYCCADDTHGAPIEIKAAELGIKPEELIAKVHKEHVEDFAKYHIGFDNYYTTHSKENQELATEIFNRLKKKGLIYTKDVESFYDAEAKRFLPDRYVKGTCPKCRAEDQYGDVCEKCNSTYTPTDLVKPYSTLTKSTPVRKTSIHYFFKLSAMTQKLQNFFRERSFQPEIVNYLNNWINEGLQDWDISRDGPYFGFNIPGEADKYFYVWLDAPIGYFASCKNYCARHGLQADDYLFGKDTSIIHFIGKDIIYFHFLFWPAMLMAADFNLPDMLHVHGFLTVEKEKMSKSRGTFYTAKQFAEEYPAEYLRYYYAKMLSKKMSDIDLDFEDFVKAVNNELVANLGNFCFRCISFVNKQFDGKITTLPKEEQLRNDIEIKIKEIESAYHDTNFGKAVREIMTISSLGNKYFQDHAPWKLVKEGKIIEAQEVCAFSINIVKDLSILLAPILPVFSAALQKQLKLSKNSWKDIGFNLSNHSVDEAQILIEKVEQKKHEEMIANLKIAEIIGAEKHPNADKLLKLQIDLGTEKRQICAGISSWYTPEELIGKRIIVVTNLKPAKLRGEESQGMLLAADCGDSVKVVFVKNSKPGEQVFADHYGTAIQSKQITIDEFSKVTLTINNKQVQFEGHPLKTATEEILIDAPDGAKVK
ncbi:methionine--tRNA ligase [Candidatus Woesearchaeota archaeon CG10_big_fil_rev_8_21_14_0_10_34_8]|nr:MAG: methionine--tRNA ligase [Candidatus Woesearchaeota archaeon CG10_big_fil_rev_8_21_14_0_10_34_8]